MFLFLYEKRKESLEPIRYVDLMIPKEAWNQKKTDVHEYHIGTFVIGELRRRYRQSAESLLLMRVVRERRHGTRDLPRRS